jgi:four helix bundle protein
MFDFEKLEVYQYVREANTEVFKFLNREKNIDPVIGEQWKKASLSSLLNLAEGTGRMSNEDKKHFLTISRGSIFECVAILHTLFDLGTVGQDNYEELYLRYERISKMLLGMYRSYQK